MRKQVQKKEQLPAPGSETTGAYTGAGPGARPEVLRAGSAPGPYTLQDESIKF